MRKPEVQPRRNGNGRGGNGH